MEIRLIKGFKEFLKLLNDHGVRYLLVGGYAVGFHGYPRGTKDLDIWVSPDPVNAEQLTKAVREFGFDLSEVTTALFMNPDQIVRMGVQPNQLELFTRMPGVEFEECCRERVISDFEGVAVDIICLDHLLKSKRASGRYRDLDDIENLT